MWPKLVSLTATMIAASALSGCSMFSMFGSWGYTATNPRECLMRAMYFESNRSSAEGMLAVGTVVMNRLNSPQYPKTICGVVGQKNQFAEGVLNRPMSDASVALVAEMADRVMAGERHPGVGNAQFFHTAGLTFPYNNMHYVLVAGGNAFYEKY
ncbi:cell wall hydrolase [Youhaiella tibetensis]|uniref:Cell wall hydrolase n=1 Tax=Paradevosia tibetensis TaxID=1447062 RepID=A0A5B9DLS0_9HYPH|nr:spore-cortex-lytic enzyme prepeptide [Devosia sp. H5989]QEE20271.1 cell wall hydrolase [Youhaiella tibetensis]GGF25546.1 cell wall hydrolase [Youhaiella tibetensis]